MSAAEASVGVMDAENVERHALVTALRARGAIRSDAVERAFRTVRREVFVPGAALAEVYADRTHVVARDGDDVVSTVSAPSIHATMLERAGIVPGAEVLEIGSGGCNAALLAELVAPEGRVRSVDIDPRVTARTTDALARHGTPVDVTVEVADAWSTDCVLADHRYDVVHITVDTWTLPPWLLGALRPGARVVAPMRLCGIGAGFAFTREGDRLVGRDAFPGGFVAARGAGAVDVHRQDARAGDVVFTDIDGIDDAWVGEALARPAAPIRTGVELAPMSPFLRFFLWLLCGAEPAASIFSASRGQDPSFPGSSWMRTPVWLSDDGFATVDGARRATGPEVVVRGFGAGGADLAERLALRVRAWQGRSGEPVLEAIPAESAARVPLVDPAHTRVLRRGAWEFRLRWED